VGQTPWSARVPLDPPVHLNQGSRRGRRLQTRGLPHQFPASGSYERMSVRVRTSTLIELPGYDLLFFLGILAPDFRASLSAIATACFRLCTFLRPPDFNVPSLYSCITFLVLVRPFVAGEDFFVVAFFVAIVSP
jgi:hypothetical protein